MTDENDDTPRKTPPTPEEVAEYEREVRHLIQRRAPFDKHMHYLRDRLAENDEQPENRADDGLDRPALPTDRS
jgi:hypothetical protein